MDLFKIILLISTIATVAIWALEDNTTEKKPEELSELDESKPSSNVKRSIANYGYNFNNRQHKSNRFDNRPRKTRTRKSRRKNRKSSRFGKGRTTLDLENKTPHSKIKDIKPIININFDSGYSKIDDQDISITKSDINPGYQKSRRDSKKSDSESKKLEPEQHGNINGTFEINEQQQKVIPKILESVNSSLGFEYTKPEQKHGIMNETSAINLQRQNVDLKNFEMVNRSLEFEKDTSDEKHGNINGTSGFNQQQQRVNLINLKVLNESLGSEQEKHGYIDETSKIKKQQQTVDLKYLKVVNKSLEFDQETPEEKHVNIDETPEIHQQLQKGGTHNFGVVNKWLGFEQKKPEEDSRAFKNLELENSDVSKAKHEKPIPESRILELEPMEVESKPKDSVQDSNFTFKNLEITNSDVLKAKHEKSIPGPKILELKPKEVESNHKDSAHHLDFAFKNFEVAHSDLSKYQQEKFIPEPRILELEPKEVESKTKDSAQDSDCFLKNLELACSDVLKAKNEKPIQGLKILEFPTRKVESENEKSYVKVKNLEPDFKGILFKIESNLNISEIVFMNTTTSKIETNSTSKYKIQSENSQNEQKPNLKKTEASDKKQNQFEPQAAVSENPKFKVDSENIDSGNTNTEDKLKIHQKSQVFPVKNKPGKVIKSHENNYFEDKSIKKEVKLEVAKFDEISLSEDKQPRSVNKDDVKLETKFKKSVTENTNKVTESAQSDFESILSDLGIKTSEPQFINFDIEDKSTRELKELVPSKVREVTEDFKRPEPTLFDHNIIKENSLNNKAAGSIRSESKLKQYKPEFKKPIIARSAPPKETSNWKYFSQPTYAIAPPQKKLQPKHEGVKVEYRKGHSKKETTTKIQETVSEKRANKTSEPKRINSDSQHKITDVRSGRYKPKQEGTEIGYKDTEPEVKHNTDENLPLSIKKKSLISTFEFIKPKLVNSSPILKKREPKIESSYDLSQSNPEYKELKPVILVPISQESKLESEKPKYTRAAPPKETSNETSFTQPTYPIVISQKDVRPGLKVVEVEYGNNNAEKEPTTQIQKVVPEQRSRKTPAPRRIKSDFLHTSADIRSSRYEPENKKTEIGYKKTKPEVKHNTAENLPRHTQNKPDQVSELGFTKLEPNLVNSSPTPRKSGLGNVFRKTKPDEAKIKSRHDHRKSKPEYKELEPLLLVPRPESRKQLNPKIKPYNDPRTFFETDSQNNKSNPKRTDSEPKYGLSKAGSQRPETRQRQSQDENLTNTYRKNGPRGKDIPKYGKPKYIDDRHDVRKPRTEYPEPKGYKDLGTIDIKYESLDRKSGSYEPRYKELKPGYNKVIRENEKSETNFRQIETKYKRKPDTSRPEPENRKIRSRFERVRSVIRKPDIDRDRGHRDDRDRHVNKYKKKEPKGQILHSNIVKEKERPKYIVHRNNEELEYKASKIELNITTPDVTNSETELKSPTAKASDPILKYESENGKTVTEKLGLETETSSLELTTLESENKWENTTQKQNFLFKVIKNWW